MPLPPPPVIHRSPHPDVDIPVRAVLDVLYSNNPNVSDDRPAYIDGPTGAVMTFGQLRHRVDTLGTGLRAHFPTLPRFSTVAMYSPNHLEFVATLHAAIRAGFSVSPINPTYSPDEVVHQLTDSGARILVAHPSLAKAAIAAAARAGIPKTSIFFLASPTELSTIPKGYRCIADLQDISDVPDSVLSSLPAEVYYRPHEIISEATYRCYSSGTTGRSKGVDSSQYGVISNVFQVLPYIKKVGVAERNSVWLNVLPLFHIYGLVLCAHINIFVGIPVVLFPRFDPTHFLSSIPKYRVSFAFVVPPILVVLAKMDVGKYDLSSLKLMVSGSAPLGADLANQIWNKMHVPTSQGYGMTETSTVTHLNLPTIPQDGSVGELIPNIECRILDPETGLDAPRGEMCIRGPNVMLGYHNNIEATRNTIDREGWLHTGDVAEIRNGKYYIVDRIKELIKFKGFQVAPAELEHHLLSCSEVADAAVIGHPDHDAGELPRAFVVMQPNAKMTPRQVREFIDAKVGATKRLRGGVVVVKEIPKSASGKILRRVLRDLNAKLPPLDNGSMDARDRSKL